MIESLKGVSAYPIPLRTLVETAEKRGLDLDGEATAEVLTGKAFSLVKADLLLWLSIVPNVSQGGQSYSFSDQQRKDLRNQAQALYKEFEPDGAAIQKPIYGYKGSRL